MEDMKYLHTTDGISVTIGGRPYSISAHQVGFDEVRAAVTRGDDPVKVLALIQAKANMVRRIIEDQMRAQSLTGKLTYEEGLILYDGKPLYNYAAETLLKFLNMGHDCRALSKFIEKQQQNPDAMVHDELYKFLEVGKIPLTPEGNFLTYKAVRGDYRDIHSGTFLNRVGDSPRLSGGRQAVDPNRERTCSYGLHVCSFGYLPNFAHNNGHVMICEVDPRDVVAIPADYNNTKMRVIGYKVVGEVTSYYGNGRDILSESRLAEQSFEVTYEDEAMVTELYDAFFTKEEAVEVANGLMAGGRWQRVAVVDARTEEVVHVA